MSSHVDDQKLLQTTCDASSQTSQLAANLPTHFTVDSTDSSKAGPVVFAVTEHGSLSSGSASSADGGDERTNNDSETSDSSHTSTSSIQATGDWDSHCLPADYDNPLVTVKRLPLRFCDPLSEKISDILFWDSVAVSAESHPFLCSFLRRTRYTDIPFSMAHRLLDTIMHALQWAAYRFLKSRGLGCLYIAGEIRESADEVELEHLVGQIIKQKLIDPSWRDDLYHLRLAATHSCVYDTGSIRKDVIFLGLMNDKEELTRVERLLRTTYYREKRSPEEVSDDDIKEADLALHYTPAEPVTQHLLLHRVQELLERACFNYWVKHNPQRLIELEWYTNDVGVYDRKPVGTVPLGWDCPERVELQNWWYKASWNFVPWPQKPDTYDPDRFYKDDFNSLLKSAVALRNQTAHRIYRERGETLFDMLRDAEDLARVLDDQAASQEISGLRDHHLCQKAYATQSELTEERRLESKKKYDEANMKWQAWLAAGDLA